MPARIDTDQAAIVAVEKVYDMQHATARRKYVDLLNVQYAGQLSATPGLSMAAAKQKLWMLLEEARNLK